MSSPLPESEPASITLGDIYYVLFRHKWKILVCTCAGVIFAFLAHRQSPRPFQSEAKLFIRYVTDRKSLAPSGAGTTAKSPDQRGETILDSEVEIITSLDLARQVAEAIGPTTLLGPSADNPSVLSSVDRAAAVIKKNLTVEIPARSSVIRLVFKHPNPDVVQPALVKLIEHYLKLHSETHRAGNTVGDFLAQETNQFRSRLAQTEDELRKVRNKTGLISLEGTYKTNPELIAAVRQQIFASEAELAERSLILTQRQKRTADRTAETPPVGFPDAAIPVDQVNRYHSLVASVGLLRRTEQELLTQFREESSRVKDVRAQLAIAEAAKRALEDRFTSLVQSAPTVTRQTPTLDVGWDNEAESARILALEAKIKVLKLQLEELRDEVVVIDQIEPKIVELRRKKELEEANYRYFSTNLEQARIDDALAAGQVSNISMIQTPSPPALDNKGTSKLIALLGAGGIIAGIGWAFLIELYLDRTIKRRSDIERIICPPLFLSIPYLRNNGTRLQTGPVLTLQSETSLGGINHSRPLGPFHATLRDQIIGHFEANGLLRKPKLVAVSGIGSQAGVSTTASGLARSLSEIDEGNVLLVDMTIGQESARHFIRGEAKCDLNQVLDALELGKVEGNLYVVSENTTQDRLSNNLPQRFSKIAPKLKASAFDYIIFDLPPVTPISITNRLAAFMDLVLLVVQSEKTDHVVLERATTLLSQTNIPVGIVLNKTRAYVPSWLQQHTIGET